jgi:hypothetical protein
LEGVKNAQSTAPQIKLLVEQGANVILKSIDENYSGHLKLLSRKVG